ncbi:MAG: AMP-binding protein [Rikenellaceae bacterium]
MALRTLKELYNNSITNFADRRVSAILDVETLTYSDFANRVDNLINILSNSGLEQGDKVVLLSSNMPNWGVSYFAITISGLVVVPILPDFAPAEVDKIIAHSEAKALIVSDKLYQKVSKETVKSLNVVIRAVTFAVLSSTDTTPTDLSGEIYPESLAAIIYTSGTTSSPKGVMHSHKSLCAQVDMLFGIQDANPDDVMVSVLPLSHTYECSLGLLYPFAAGASVCYLEKPPTASVLKSALAKERPTMMLTVPLIMEKMYRSQILAPFTANKFLSAIYNFAPTRKFIHHRAGKKLMQFFGGRMRFFAIGGAKVDPVVDKFLKEANFPYGIGYGLTETAPLVAGRTATMEKRIESTGPILKEVEYRLDNINPITGEGELVVKTPAIMMGYYKNPEATKEVLTEDGWFRTRDLVVVDKDGFIFVKGRLSNMILGPSGENIYPEEIEHVLNGHKLVTESMVKEEQGQLIALVHFDTEELEKRYRDMKDEFQEKMEDVKREIVTYVNSKVNRFSRISTVEEMSDGFEKTPTHKIKRFIYQKKNKDTSKK